VALVLAGHAGAVNTLAFSRDGRRLVTGSEDQTLKLWDAATGEEVFTLRGHQSIVLGVAFSPDGLRIASAGGDLTVRLWEAVTPSPESARRRRLVAQAEPLVESLFGTPLLQEDVIERLRADPALAEPVRALALEIARRTVDPPHVLNDVSWHIARAPNRRREDYERAVRHAEAASRRDPENGLIRNTLGVAQYRAERYVDALKTLTESDRLNAAAFKGSMPGDLAFLAMAHHRLGHGAEARACLDRLREAMKTPRWRTDTEAVGFLREAETLVGAPDSGGGKR
jgi:hypothetical protein